MQAIRATEARGGGAAVRAVVLPLVEPLLCVLSTHKPCTTERKRVTDLQRVRCFHRAVSSARHVLHGGKVQCSILLRDAFSYLTARHPTSLNV